MTLAYASVPLPFLVKKTSRNNQRGCYYVRIFIQGGSVEERMEDVDAPEEYQHDCVFASSTVALFWNRVRSVKIITDMQKSLKLAKDDDEKDDHMDINSQTKNSSINTMPIPGCVVSGGFGVGIVSSKKFL
eukprot:CAMPEP_0176496050 /NCGR_PEP_ID=MMETSP0200_2-20121128/10992_1 /TAXON_ID=947934 /ORGANISM="Chaetoceros sp., Strain GSL56" /LENGTH=130 /DNA_ID=CAMNT_0017893987 /DNA_START=1227 /DNA_END=1615 /DNA_ORIENTATION=+